MAVQHIRTDDLLPFMDKLTTLGFTIEVTPDGAGYVDGPCGRFGEFNLCPYFDGVNNFVTFLPYSSL